MNPLLEVDHLSFGYHPNEYVLKDVSFSVADRQFLGLIGPNGSGKSTLLRLLLGLLTPWKGTIVFRDDEAPHRVAYVPQAFNLDKYFPITVLEVVLGGRASYISRFGQYRTEDKKAATEALEKVGLPHRAKDRFADLSGGQAQRVLIARALASHPTILLLDEPTSSTDHEAEESILATIRTLHTEMTILMATHNLRAILTHVDGILCVQGGGVMLHPREVCEHFALGLYHIPLIETPDHHFTHVHEGRSI